MHVLLHQKRPHTIIVIVYVSYQFTSDIVYFSILIHNYLAW
jgi:hypothetical protein